MADTLRWIALIEGCMLIGMSVFVIYECRIFRTPPRYIYAIATSYVMLVLGWMTEIASRLGDGFHWRTPTGVIAFTVGLMTMFGMWRYYAPKTREARHKHAATERAKQILLDEAARRVLEGHRDV